MPIIAVMPRRMHRFHTDCTSSTDQLIRSMVDGASDITRRTFLKYIDKEELREIEQRLGYASHPKQGLTMAADWHVSYHRSRYSGRPCVFFCWSCIEHVFLEVK